MPEEIYKLVYRSPPDQFVADHAKIRAELNKTRTAADKLDAMLIKLGASHPGLTTLLAELLKINPEILALTRDAKSADTAIDRIGKGNRSIPGMTKNLERLDVELKQKVIDANAATAALTNVAQAGSAAAMSGPGSPGTSPGTGVKSAGLSNLKFAGRVAGAGAIAYGVASRAVARAGQTTRERSENAVGRITEVRNQLSPYAKLVGSPDGVSDKIVDYATSVALRTGGSVDDAIELISNFEESAPTGRDKGNLGGMRRVDPKDPMKKISTPSQEKLERDIIELTGKFAASSGLDAKTAGNIAGSIGQYAKINTVDDFTKQLAEMFYGLNEGKGQISTLARSELGQAASSITNGYTSGVGELGAFIGVASALSKTASSSGTTYSGLNRLLNTLEGEGGYEFLVKSGIKEEKGDFAKLKKLKQYLNENKIETPTDFIKAQGFGNSTDIKSTVGFLSSADVLEERIKAAQATPAKVVYDFNESVQRSQLIRTMKSETAKDVSVIEQGKFAEKISEARNQARAYMDSPYMNDPNAANKGRLTASGWMATIGDMIDAAASPAGNTGEELRVDRVLLERLIQGGKKVGIDINKEYPDIARDATSNLQSSLPNQLPWRTVDDLELNRQYAEASSRITAAGGDPLGGMAEAGQKMMEAGRASMEAGQSLMKATRGQKAPPRVDPTDGKAPGRR